jgi:O-antigen/teichoic acid export membrane protein
MLQIRSRLTGRQVPRGSFGANVLVLMTGTTIAHLIPLASSPVLTRLYTPREFGGDPLARLFGEPGISRYLYLVPPMVFLMSVYQTLACWVNRKQEYVRLGASDITLKVASEGVKLGTGVATVRDRVGNGLIVGTLAGQAIATSVLSWQFWRVSGARTADVEVRRMIDSSRVYKKFATYNLPYSLISTFSNEFLIVALTAFGHLHVAGFLGFTRRILLGPISFLSSSLGRVFYREAAVSFGTRRLEDLAVRLMRMLADLATPLFMVIAFWAPDLFGVVFGAQWVEAGYYASVMVPAAYCSLYTSWTGRIYEVARKQQVSLLIQLSADAGRLALVWGLLRAGVEPLLVTLSYSVASCLYHGAYLFGVFRVGAFRLSRLWALGKRMLGLAILFGVAFSAIRLSTQEVRMRVVASGLVLMAYYALWLVRRTTAGGRSETRPT